MSASSRPTSTDSSRLALPSRRAPIKHEPGSRNTETADLPELREQFGAALADAQRAVDADEYTELSAALDAL
jgi:hypothetical protein